MSCIDPSDPLTEALRLLATGPKPADLLPPDGLAELRELRRMIRDEMVDLAEIG